MGKPAPLARPRPEAVFLISALGATAALLPLPPLPPPLPLPPVALAPQAATLRPPNSSAVPMTPGSLALPGSYPPAPHVRSRYAPGPGGAPRPLRHPTPGLQHRPTRVDGLPGFKTSLELIVTKRARVSTNNNSLGGESEERAWSPLREDRRWLVDAAFPAEVQRWRVDVVRWWFVF